MEGKQFSRLIGENGSQIPSILSVTDFFFARAPEVVKLYNAAKPRVAVIPNHLRRRVKSFRPYNFRPKLGKSKLVFPRTLSRRTRRLRRMYLLEDEGEKTRLPGTHVWHAKRFRMENIWGMRLPTHVSGKGPRALLRLSQQSCLVHDRSYLDCWRISADNKESLGSLLIEKGFSSMIAHQKVVSGDFFASGLVTADRYVLSTYQAVWASDECVVDVFTHPSARPEIEVLMESVNGTLQNRQERYELIGSRVEQVLQKVLGVGFDSLEMIPGKVTRIPGLDAILNVRACGYMVDLIFGRDAQSFYLWRQFVQAGASPIGVIDRHNLLTHTQVPDFPFDFPTAKAGSRQIALQARAVLVKDQARPKHCKLDTSTVESPFFPDWSLIGCERIPPIGSLQPVAISARRGVLKFNSHIYCENRLVGFVTSASGNSESRGIAFVVGPWGESTSEVEFRNPGSCASFPADIQPCNLLSTDASLFNGRTYRSK